MDVRELLAEAFGRIPEIVRSVVDGLDAEALAWRPDGSSNSIAWLAWHLVRVQDDHVADVAGTPQVWESDAWPDRFGLPPGAMDTGYGHSPEQVAAVRVRDGSVLLDYLDAVVQETHTFLGSLDEDALDRIVDTSWNPPVTLGVRLISVVDDGLQHAGQAAYLRGLYERSSAAAR